MQYPEVPPNIRFINPRGISEESYHQLIGEVNQHINENVGLPVMFDVLQHCADFIFEHQHSSSSLCPICLCPMASSRVSCTPCDHYAHTHCLDLHIEHTRRQLGEKLSARDFKMCGDIDKSLRCPVCRVVIDKEVDPILPSSTDEWTRKSHIEENGMVSSRSPSEEESHVGFEFDWEKWRQQQALMKVIFEKQKEKGGIIDLEEERRKILVTENTVVLLNNELEALSTVSSVSNVPALTVSGRAETTNSNTTTILDVSSGVVQISPIVSPTNASRSENRYFHRGRTRKFPERRDGGDQKKKFHAKHKEGITRGSMKNVYTLSNPTLSNPEIISTSSTQSTNLSTAHLSAECLESSVKVTQRRGSSIYKNAN
ncbi:zinc finger, C3HC4 type [Dictyocaulus viviparus]|uniref:Zinc finger, C3HC4 type n=1 Tax=Dictyocaulus viviparus TaxID=29172 RepID=A0A0D8YAL5_DICVI|nr:zinc finger, C3HC4 type [Dictyocaulus viviparus]